MHTITNPISSDNVIDVGVSKPKCFTDCGNSLNDWLKWLAYDKCSNWDTLNTQCLRDYLEDGDTKEQDLEKIITLLVDVTCQLIDQSQQSCCDTTIVNLTIDPLFSTTAVNRATKKNQIVYLEGLISGDSGYVTTLPLGYRPLVARIIPIVCTDLTVLAYLTIGTNGEITLNSDGVDVDYSLDCSFKI